MQNTISESSFVSRLRQILASRYGKGLQIRQLVVLSDPKYDQDMFMQGGDLHIPIKVNGSFLGTAIVPSSSDLDHENSHSVAQLVRMVLEPTMYQWYLTRRESNLQEITKANISIDNVQLFGEVSDDKESSEFNTFPNPDLGPALSPCSHIIHLEGGLENSRKKVALLLHEMTGRWAFVPFNDIKSQLHSLSDFLKLGGMTIYVENVETLNQSEQELILGFLKSDLGKNDPLFVCTSNMSADQIYANCSLKKEFVEEILAQSFEVERSPLSCQGLREVLELFFFAKDEPMDA